jgi:hypothetical protein
LTRIDDSFSEDALNRAGYANRLTAFIQSQESCVIAVDGEWGSGKTWLGERVKSLLEAGGGCKTVWINTFEADWEDDPALTLLASFASMFPQEKRSQFIESVAPILSKVATTALKAGVNATGAFLGVGANAVELVSDLFKDAGNDLFTRKLQDLTDRKKSLEALRLLVENAVTEFGGKVVVFVDELDRCSPTYAIRFLERLKHLFEIQGVVYVLLWNREQIQSTVKAFYGPETNGLVYLDKFVNYPLHLPASHWPEPNFPMHMLIANYVRKLDGRKQGQFNDSARVLGALSGKLRMTARETLRVASWWALSPDRRFIMAETWLLCLKAKRPDVYEGIRRSSSQSHQSAAEILNFGSGLEQNFKRMFLGLRRLHERTATNDFGNIEEEVFTIVGGPHNGVNGFFEPLIERLDSTFS